MKFDVSENVYTMDTSEKSFKKTLRTIARKKPVAGLFLVTEPLFDAGIMEIYDYNELLQPYYRKKKVRLKILGIASSRDEAKQLVADIYLDNCKQKEMI